MKNHIVFFSGGLSSFAVAHLLKTKYPGDNIVLYFTDTLWEDEDLYRFIDEASSKLKLPLLTHSIGIDPVELMIKQRIIFNSRMGNCSSVLKMKVASDYLKKGKIPPVEKWSNKDFLKNSNFIDNATLYFGITFDEFHRTKAIAENWAPFPAEFPLCKTYIDYDDLLALYGIEKPRMYLKGFSHNNCKGRCVKAGKGHYKLLYNEDRHTFDEIKHIEWILAKYVAAYHAVRKWKDGDFYDQQIFKMAEPLLVENEQEMLRWHNSHYHYKPNLHFIGDDLELHFSSIIKGTNLRSLKHEGKHNIKLDLFTDEIGGCGCFVEYA